MQSMAIEYHFSTDHWYHNCCNHWGINLIVKLTWDPQTDIEYGLIYGEIFDGFQSIQCDEYLEKQYYKLYKECKILPL